MKWLLPAIAAALLAASPALAQEAPGGVPLGSGVQRGIEQLNNSGQAGYVTLFGHGTSTMLVAEVLGGPGGRTQMTAVQRGKNCASMETAIAQRAGDLHNGRGRGSVPMAESRLLSGNYVFVVYSSDAPGARPVACAQLFQ